MIPIYLAASSSDASRVRANVARLDDSGLFHITSRWFENCDSWTGRDSALTRERATEIAEDCLNAVQRSAIVWLLAPPTLSGGSMVEFGAALAFATLDKRRKVVVSGFSCSRTLFTALATFRDPSDDVALVETCRIALDLEAVLVAERGRG
jgi:hypothetical protein